MAGANRNNPSGGGEWPDKDAPPSGAAPGSTAAAPAIKAERADVPHRDNPADQVSAEDAATRTTPDDD